MNDELEKRLTALEDALRGLAESDEQLAAAESRNDQVKAQKAHQDFIVDVYSRLFDKSAAYVNVICLAGYAGCFALWTVLQSHISIHRNSWIALFLGSSLITFVLYELYKMVTTAIVLKKTYALAFSNELPEDYQRRVDAVSKAEAFVKLSYFPAWCVAFSFAAVTGLVAAGILFWNYVRVVLS